MPEHPAILDAVARRVHVAAVARDVGVALARAAATMDFEVLRFAGIRVDASGKASLVTGASMPRPAWRTGLGPRS